MEEHDMEWSSESDSDSDSDGSVFYEPIRKQLEEYFKNTDYTASARSSTVSTSLNSFNDDEDIITINDALILNKQTDSKYEQLQKVLYETLSEIRQKIQENSQAIMSHSNTIHTSDFNYLRSGKPYFKDKNNFPAPDNADTILMRQSQMFDFSSVSSVPGWTVNDKAQLVNVLQDMSREIHAKQINSQINSLQRENKPENIWEITKLEKQLSTLKKKSLKQIALPFDEEYDWEAVANKLNRRHSAQEYRSLWKLFFHPTINKNNWSKPEHQSLQNIATKHKMQDWDLIAKELNTGRTGYQCFVYFRTIMVDNLSNRRWTVEEIEYLQRVIEYFREGTYIPWGKVATAMDNRTKIQVYNKYTRMMEHRKGRFLEEEDIIILNCYDKFGLDFKKMSEYLPGRSIVQLRTRFSILTKFRVSTTWTVDDDRKLLQIMANQNSNSNFSAATPHFPGKDRMHIRSRYLTLMKWTKANPGVDIIHAPRRGARRLVHGYSNMTLNEALLNLSKRMECEVKKRKSRRLTIESSEKDIEDGIIAALMNEIIKEESFKKPDAPDIEEMDVSHTDSQSADVSNLQRILAFLNASLDIEKFKMSKYSKIYKDLRGINRKPSDVKVKSYSKTQKIQTIEMTNAPDIWGNRTLGRTKYVFPPNFSTITGCRVLMNYISMKPIGEPEDEINLSLMARRNTFFKDALGILKARFETLFIWPLLLSNESPHLEKQAYVPYLHTSKQRALPEPTGITIPRTSKRQITTCRNIDLSEEESSMADINVSESFIENAAMNADFDDSN